MAKYTEEEISKIIIDVERLIDVEDVPVEDTQRVQEVKKVQNPKNAILSRYFEEKNNSEDFFEESFNDSRRKRQNVEIPETVNYVEIFCSSDNTKEDDKDIKLNSQRAVTINSELKFNLLQLRQSLEDMRSSVDERLKTLEQFLEDVKLHEKDSANSKTTYVKCGSPFFKDALGYPAPENPDFKYRKNVLKEYFPFDAASNKSPWEKDEKTQLVQGMKEQMINHIQTQQSKKICQENKKTRGKMQKIRYIFNSKDLQETSMLKLYETIQNEYPDFWTAGVNWSLISFNSLEGNHTVSECMGMWHSYLKPDINRDPFSDEENAILAHIIVEFKHQDWNLIASQLERRTSLQTFIHYNSERSRLCPPNVRWTPEEDQKLINAVKAHSRGKDILWHNVGTAIENRNKTQCYNRYIIMLRQRDSKKGVFKPYEDRILLDYVAKHGTDFSKMSSELLPNRSIVQIKNHYNVALKHKGKVNPWTREEDQMLMDFVTKEGTNSWFKIAEMLKTHNRLSCRTRFTTIQKFLRKNPDKTVADTPSRLKTVTAVHKAIQSDDEEISDNEDYQRNLNSKAFGMLTFEEFKLKNVQLYNLLKITYNYKLHIVNELNIDIPKFLALKQLMDIDDSAMKSRTPYLLTVNQHRKLREALSKKLDTTVEKEIQHVKLNYDFYMPPNYSTAMGLRAIAIKTIDETVVAAARVENTSQEYVEAQKRFTDQFYSLFYWPAMISRLKESELRSNYLIRDSKNNTIEIVNYVQKDSPVITKDQVYQMRGKMKE